MTHPCLAEAVSWQPIGKNIRIASHSSVPFTHTHLQQSLPVTGVKKGGKLSTPSSIESIKDSCLSTMTLIVIYLKREGMLVVLQRRLLVSRLWSMLWLAEASPKVVQNTVRSLHGAKKKLFAKVLPWPEEHAFFCFICTTVAAALHTVHAGFNNWSLRTLPRSYALSSCRSLLAPPPFPLLHLFALRT